MKYFFPALIVLLLSSCENLEPTETVHFFNLDSLVTAQIKYLSDANPEVMKSGNVEGEDDKGTVTRPDSIQWTRELAIFKSADINKPRLRERYREEVATLDNGLKEVSYVPVEKGDLKVQHMTIRYDDNVLQDVEVMIIDSNPLYASERQLKMSFEKAGPDIRLASYYIGGGQKMKLKDSVTFDLRAEVSYQDGLK